MILVFTKKKAMKRIVLILTLMAFLSDLRAPSLLVGYIVQPEEISYYTSLIKAITTIESNNGKYVFNKKEGAVGYFQIRQCRVDHYNRLKGTNYKLEDFYDYNLSRDMFLYFAKGKSYEKAAKDWNGSGPMVKVYWKKIKLLL